MPHIANGHQPFGGKIRPTDAETIRNLGNPEHTKPTTKKNFFTRIFKRSQKSNDEQNKKPEGPKLKTFEIVCFLSYYSIDI